MRPRGRPKKQWIDGIKQDLKKLGISNRKKKIQNQENLKEESTVEKAHKEL